MRANGRQRGTPSGACVRCRSAVHLSFWECRNCRSARCSLLDLDESRRYLSRTSKHCRVFNSALTSIRTTLATILRGRLNGRLANLRDVGLSMEMHDRPTATTRVLVIDDDLSVRTAIQAILNRGAFETVLAPDAHAGIQSFVSYKFDVVIVDIFLSGMNGLETIVFIRRQAPKVPLIAMSGLRGGGSDLLGIAAELGANVCLRKPFAPRQLLGAIHMSLEWAYRALSTEPQQKEDR